VYIGCVKSNPAIASAKNPVHLTRAVSTTMLCTCFFGKLRYAASVPPCMFSTNFVSGSSKKLKQLVFGNLVSSDLACFSWSPEVRKICRWRWGYSLLLRQVARLPCLINSWWNFI